MGGGNAYLRAHSCFHLQFQVLFDYVEARRGDEGVGRMSGAVDEVTREGEEGRWQVCIFATSTAACLEFGELRGDVETQGGDDGVWMWVCGQRNEWGEEVVVVLRTCYPSPPPTFPALSTPLSRPPAPSFTPSR